MDKRIYSLNLASYLLSESSLRIDDIKIFKDEEIIDKDIFYTVFPDTDEIEHLISIYKNTDCTINLHKFLNSFKALKSVIYYKRKLGAEYEK